MDTGLRRYDEVILIAHCSLRIALCLPNGQTTLNFYLSLQLRKGKDLVIIGMLWRFAIMGCRNPTCALKDDAMVNCRRVMF